MERDLYSIPARGLSHLLDKLFRSRRYIVVRVLEGGREQDAFQASSSDILREALRPIYRRLDPATQIVEFSGTEERWLSGGPRRTARDVRLGNLAAALAFLAGEAS